MGRNSILITLCLLPFWSLSQQIYTTKTGTVDFTSNAPLEVIKASSSELQGALNTVDKTFAFIIQNRSFKGFNSSLQQEHFYENYMEVQEFPASSFKGKIIESIDYSASGEQTVRAKGTLDIHGVEQERIIKGTILRKGDNLVIRASFTVPLEEHNIKIPRVVYQKIAEVIEVKIEAELTPKTN